MHFLLQETLSFNLMYVAACYPVGTTISKTSSLFTALLQHYNDQCPLRIELSSYYSYYVIGSRARLHGTLVGCQVNKVKSLACPFQFFIADENYVHILHSQL